MNNSNDFYKPSYKWHDDDRYVTSHLHWDCCDLPILNVIQIFQQVSKSFKDDQLNQWNEIMAMSTEFEGHMSKKIETQIKINER